jgi:hypothetical protein
VISDRKLKRLASQGDRLLTREEMRKANPYWKRPIVNVLLWIFFILLGVMLFYWQLHSFEFYWHPWQALFGGPGR